MCSQRLFPYMPSTPAEEWAGEGSGLSQWPGRGPSLAWVGGSEDRRPCGEGGDHSSLAVRGVMMQAGMEQRS